MSYIRAEEVLPRDLIDAIQQYVDGKAIYIPSRQKKPWGSGTGARTDLFEGNRRIFEEFQSGTPILVLADRYAVSDKSIQRILRKMKETEPNRAT